MTATAPDHNFETPWNWVLSVALHLLAVLLLLAYGLMERSRLDGEPPQVAMEVVFEHPPQPKASPPPPQPAPEPKAEPPRPEKMAVPPPQLTRARVAEKSASPQAGAKGDAIRVAPDGIAVMMGRQADTPRQHNPNVAELSQSAQDFVLAQVVRMWRFNTLAFKGTNWAFSANLVINRDGTLVGPMNKNAPWNPAAIIQGYDTLKEGTLKQALDSFLLALRMAQPLELPPDDGKGWPRRMTIRFRPGDL